MRLQKIYVTTRAVHLWESAFFLADSFITYNQYKQMLLTEGPHFETHMNYYGKIDEEQSDTVKLNQNALKQKINKCKTVILS